MKLSKGLYDRQNKGNIVTTILGIIGILAQLAVGVGWITIGQSTDAVNYITTGAGAVQTIIGCVLGLIATFSPAPAVVNKIANRLFTLKKAA